MKNLTSAATSTSGRLYCFAWRLDNRRFLKRCVNLAVLHDHRCFPDRAHRFESSFETGSEKTGLKSTSVCSQSLLKPQPVYQNVLRINFGRLGKVSPADRCKRGFKYLNSCAKKLTPCPRFACYFGENHPHTHFSV